MRVQDERLKRALAISIGLHFGVIGALLIKEQFQPGSPVPILPSLKVDLVALPDQKKPADPVPVPVSTPEPAAVPPPPARTETAGIEPETTDKPDFTLSKTKKKKRPSKKEETARKKLKQALARIRAIERIKALTASEPAKGNRISKGSSLSGEARKALESTYFDVVLERVRTYWELPKWLRDQNRAAKVMVYLDSQGRLKRYEFVQSSGSEPFDSEVRRTLQAATPFPVPPGGISGEIAKQGILLGFPL
ncbi:MAG: TonB family protein [Proteobacteria bacterium]|nr:TonB family protein [Pseudomonadota bacterium]